jgi:hypothetical protein
MVCQSGGFVLTPCFLAMHFQTSLSSIHRLTFEVLGTLPFGHFSVTNSKMACWRGVRSGSINARSVRRGLFGGKSTHFFHVSNVRDHRNRGDSDS